MWALVLKEFRQLRPDRRTLAMMIVLPLVLLVVFGYAASFDVSRIPTAVIGERAEQVSGRLPDVFDLVRGRSGRGNRTGHRAAAARGSGRGDRDAFRLGRGAPRRV